MGGRRIESAAVADAGMANPATSIASGANSLISFTVKSSLMVT
jgi:hypothetical protein